MTSATIHSLNCTAGRVSYRRAWLRLSFSMILLLSAAACDSLFGPPSLLDLVPRSTNALLLVVPEKIANDPDAARIIGWGGVVQELQALGLNPYGMGGMALAELEAFGKGRGNLVVGQTDTLSAVLGSSVSTGAPPAFNEAGFDFRPTSRAGWYWTGQDGEWVAACDRIGCTLAAATLADREESLFISPHEPGLTALFDKLSDDESFRMLWIPTARTRDGMEAASVWTGFSLSARFRNAVPADLMSRIGLFRGMSLQGRGRSGQLHLMLNIAMSSPESARLLAGSYGLLQGLADGMEGIARSLGVEPPPMPSKPQIEVSSEQHLVLVRIIRTP